MGIAGSKENAYGIVVETVATDYKIDNTMMLVSALNRKTSGSQILWTKKL